MYCKCSTHLIYYLYDNCNNGGNTMNKTISMSIRVSEEEIDILKKAAMLEKYSSYSEFIRRTALKEAVKVIELEEKKEDK